MKMTLKRFDDLFCAAEPVDKDTVLTLMDGAGLCAYGEHSGNYSVPVEIMHNRLARIIAVAIQIGKQSDNDQGKPPAVGGSA